MASWHFLTWHFLSENTYLSVLHTSSSKAPIKTEMSTQEKKSYNSCEDLAGNQFLKDHSSTIVWSPCKLVFVKHMGGVYAAVISTTDPCPWQSPEKHSHSTAPCQDMPNDPGSKAAGMHRMHPAVRAHHGPPCPGRHLMMPDEFDVDFASFITPCFWHTNTLHYIWHTHWSGHYSIENKTFRRVSFLFMIFLGRILRLGLALWAALKCSCVFLTCSSLYWDIGCLPKNMSKFTNYQYVFKCENNSFIDYWLYGHIYGKLFVQLKRFNQPFNKDLNITIKWLSRKKGALKHSKRLKAHFLFGAKNGG